MPVLTPKRRRTGRLTREDMSLVRDTVGRETFALRPGGLRVDFRRLADDERAELVELTKAGVAGGGFARGRVPDPARWERLVAKACGDPDAFERPRALARVQALARAAREAAARPPRRKRWEEPGAVVLSADWLLPFYEDGILFHSHMAVLVFVLAQLEAGRTISPGASIEGQGDDAVLLLKHGVGPGARFNGDQQITRWTQCLDHLAKNSLLEVERRGDTLAIGRGARVRRFNRRRT